MRLPSLNWNRGLTRLYVVLSGIAWIAWIAYGIDDRGFDRLFFEETIFYWLAWGIAFQVSSFLIFKIIIWVVTGFRFDKPETNTSVKTDDLPEDFDSDK